LQTDKQIWQAFKREFSNKNFKNMDDLNKWLFGVYNNIGDETVKSTTNYD